MGTNTNLQTLNPASAGGLASASHRRQEQTFLAGGTIAAGAAVMFDVSQTEDADKVLYVVQAPAATAAIGASLESASVAAGETVRVCLGGVCEALVEGVNSAGANTAIAAGAPLGISDNAGVYGAFTPGTDAVPSGFCVDAVLSGAATALVTVIVAKVF